MRYQGVAPDFCWNAATGCLLAVLQARGQPAISTGLKLSVTKHVPFVLIFY